MYECSFCGGDSCNYPEVLIFINRFGNTRSESTLDKIFSEAAKKYNYTPYTANPEIQEKVFKDFDHHVMNNTLWFCSKKCAQFYLTHELPEWKLDQLGE